MNTALETNTRSTGLRPAGARTTQRRAPPREGGRAAAAAAALPSTTSSQRDRAFERTQANGGRSEAETTYEAYISNHPGLAPCQRAALLNFRRLRGRLAPATDSDRQLKALCDDLYQRKATEQIARLCLLLGHFADETAVGRLLARLRAGEVSDRAAVAELAATGGAPKRKDELEVCPKWEYAAQVIALRHAARFGAKSKSYRYLDVGCGSGAKTAQFQKALGIAKSQVCGADIEAWGPYGADKRKLAFQFERIVDDTLAYDDGAFDFITCVFTMHHVQNLDALLREIRRVLRPGGHFALVEHCVYTDHDRLLVHIQHALYSAIYDKRADFVERPDFIECRNMHEWDFLLESLGFGSVEKGPLAFGSEFALSYDNAFYALFEKGA